MRPSNDFMAEIFPDNFWNIITGPHGKYFLYIHFRPIKKLYFRLVSYFVTGSVALAFQRQTVLETVAKNLRLGYTVCWSRIWQESQKSEKWHYLKLKKYYYLNLKKCNFSDFDFLFRSYLSILCSPVANFGHQSLNVFGFGLFYSLAASI